MMRSRAIVTAEITSRHPNLVPLLRMGKARAHRYALTRKIRAGALRESAAALYDMLKSEHIYAVKELGICVADNIRALLPFRSSHSGTRGSSRFARGSKLRWFDDAPEDAMPEVSLD